MQVAFIDSQKYNLDMVLLDPFISDDIAHDRDVLTHYKKMLAKLFAAGNGSWDPAMVFSLYSNIQLNLNNNSIIFNMTLTKQEYTRAKSSNYVVVTEGTFNGDDAYSATNTWFVCKVLRIERTDTNTYKIYTEIDKLRTYPQYQRVYKLYDSYNGPVEITADNPSLNYPSRVHKYFSNTSSYVAVGVWNGDFYANEYSGTPRNYKYAGLHNANLNNQTTTTQPLQTLQNDKQVYTSTYLTVFTRMYYNTAEETVIDNSDFTTELSLTSTAQSISSLTRAIEVFNAIGTSDNNIAKNLIAVYLVPKDIISTSTLCAMFSTGNNGLTYNTYDGERVLRGQPKVQDMWDGWVRFGYVCKLKSMALTATATYGTDLRTDLETVVNSEYGSTNYYSKKYVKGILDTYQQQYELTPESIEALGNYIRVVPMFNGTVMNYYITFGTYVNTTFTETNTSIKIIGKSFLQIPISTLGVEAYFNSEYRVDTIKMLGGFTGGIAGAVGGAVMGVAGATSGNMLAAVAGAGTAIAGVSTTVSSITNYNYKAYQEQSQNPEMSGATNIFITLLDGLFKITYYTAEPDIINLIHEEVNFYGVNADRVYNNSKELNFMRADETGVTHDVFTYHKGGGVFSTPELKDAFEQGIFVYCNGDSDPGTNFQNKMQNVTYLGKSTS